MHGRRVSFTSPSIHSVLSWALAFATNAVGLLCVALLLFTLVPTTAAAMDPEGCLSCHRFSGLSRLDKETGDLHLYFVSERHYTQREGPHTRLRCTDCHDRDELGTIPHDETTPVTCTQECHLVGDSGALFMFSHSAKADSVAASVHGDEAMEALAIDPRPLNPDQSTCLYCHDQPVFRDVEAMATTHRGDSADTRCGSCHGDDIPISTDYYLHHMAARIQPQRPVLESVRACAICHSDAKVNEEAGLHDAVTSYFRSFHGKAALLGSTETATCVDCHRSESGDVHLMLGAEDPESRTSEKHLALTCRSVKCHPNAVPEQSAAAVHLRVDPRSLSLEYLLLAAFVLMILFELGLNFLLFVLEMVTVAFRGQSEEHRHLEAVATAVQAHPEGRKRLERMNVNERVQHWLLVVFFTLLVVTGMPMRFATVPWMESVNALFGGLAGARLLHRVSALMLTVVFLYHLGYVIYQTSVSVRRRLAKDKDRGLALTIYDVARNSPMMVNTTDIRQFVQLFAYLLGMRKEHPHRGKYHYSEKFEYLGVFWGMVIIGLSGALLLANGWAPEYVGGRALNFAYIVHSYEAFLAIMYVVVAHIFAVTLAPHVFPMSMGSITGQVPPAEYAGEHSGYLKEVAKELGIDAEPPPKPTGVQAFLRSLVRRGYALTLAVFVVVMCYFSLRLLVQDLTGPVAAVEIESLPHRLNADTLLPVDEDAEVGVGSARRLRYERGPLSHFHIIPAWFTPDPANSCTTSGCHEQLPHGEHKEDRAFFNMHSVFLDCQVCHLEERPEASGLSWVDLNDRSARQAPAVLLLDAALEELATDEAELATQHDKLTSLLERAITESNGDTEFKRWLLQLQTARLGGVLYSSHLEEMQAGIQSHGHGEYGAKIAAPGAAVEPSPEQVEASKKLVADDSLSEKDKEELVELVHKGVVLPEVRCDMCHGRDSTYPDYESLGYTPEHARTLRSNHLAGYSDAVQNRTIHYMPRVLDPTLGPIPIDGEEPEVPVPGEGEGEEP